MDIVLLVSMIVVEIGLLIEAVRVCDQLDEAEARVEELEERIEYLTRRG